jgi:hypothetical protein
VLVREESGQVRLMRSAELSAISTEEAMVIAYLVSTVRKRQAARAARN